MFYSNTYEINNHPQIYLRASLELKKHAYDYYHITSPVKYTLMTLRVTRGDKFTPMEKLFKPFDSPTWMTLVLTLVLSLIIIVGLKVLPRKFYNFVCGSTNQNPILGFVEIIFGIGLIQTPGRNFSRFLFMMFTILCLIIRTAYQGKMFELLHYDVKQPAARSIQEVIDKQIPVKYVPSKLLTLKLDETIVDAWCVIFITTVYDNFR